MANKRPKFQISIDPEYSDGKDLGWSRTAFTNKPAIMSKGIAFHAQDRPKDMYFADKLKYRIAAPMMIPMEIYRNDDGEEYDIEFTEKKIEQIHSKFMKKFEKNKALFNDEHDNTKIAPAYLLEILRIDTAAKQEMLITDYNIKVPIGTLFGIAQITDKDYYNYLVEEGKTGFSIEGFFGLALEDDELEEYEKHNFKTESKMEKQKAQFSMNGLSAYIELPVGKTVIGNIEYTVEEFIENEGMENEYKCNRVVSMVPVSNSEAPSDSSAPVEAKEEKMSEATKEEDKKEEEVAAADDTEKKEEDAVKEDEKKEEEVAAADEEVVDETKEEVKEDSNSDSYSKEEVDAKFDELYKMIAELKAGPADKMEEKKEEEVAMSIHQRFAAFRDFSKK